ncbi:MAG: CotH kinase family protein [Prevotella sp.]|nr:CotH kinase family protein [Prevotella sp.]
MKLKTTILTIGMMVAGSLTANAQLVINEIMQSNVECILDDLNEFPDSWVELYNSGEETVNLKDYKICNKNKLKKAWQLPDQTVEAGGYALIYCDKEGKEDNRLHPDFRLESGKGCTIYLFKGKDEEPVDSLPYIYNEKKQEYEPLAKMPAPDVAFGRMTDGSAEWGYQLTPTPGKKNTGEICDAKHILGAPVFSELGRVSSNNTAFNLELSLPEGAPKDAYITYTTDGSEPTAQSTKYEAAININKTTVIRAKVFCDGWLSPLSTAQSYIFHPRKMTIPIFSVQTNDKYLNSKELGLFANNNSKEDKKLHDWRRPVNVEFFPAEDKESAFNQPGETRIQGGASRANPLKSMVFYANKRFDPDHKRFQYEFFPDQKPGITEFKSFSLRDGGNDFDDMYFRDLIIQRTMASHVEDLDWQAGHSAVLYINGEYMGMLNIRERSNEDNIYSNYDGLEDLDMVEIGHEQINGKDMFEEELKEGTADFYEAFKAFYSEEGHSLEEYEQYLDVNEYLNVVVMNLFYGNVDWPGNNTVFWRPNDDKSNLPMIWRVIVKDTDFGLGLYGRKPDLNTIDILYNPQNHPGDNWAWTEPATRLLKNMLENPDIRQMFIDKCCIFMGDFMNAEGTGAVMDAILDEALEEFVAHRDKYNGGGGWWGPTDNRADILNKFENAKKWLAGYTEQGWSGSTTYLPRTEYILQFLKKQYHLGDAIPVTINKGLTDLEDVEVKVNGIKLSEGTFGGKFFAGQNITLDWVATEEADADFNGWTIATTPKSGSTTCKFIEETTYNFSIPDDCKEVNIRLSNGLDESMGIKNLNTKKQGSWRIVGTQLILSNIERGTNISLYDMAGRTIYQGKANDNQVLIPLGFGNGSYILKTGNKVQKIR